jgi:hypothetical protein
MGSANDVSPWSSLAVHIFCERDMIRFANFRRATNYGRDMHVEYVVFGSLERRVMREVRREVHNEHRGA